MTRTFRAALAALLLVPVLAVGSASGNATPIGKLPRGPVNVVTTERGQYVAASLPHLDGLSWRVARAVNTKVVRQVSEGDVGDTVVVVFRAVGKGKATISFAATRGDSGSKAFRATTYRVTVR
jgi:hypothetical protein